MQVKKRIFAGAVCDQVVYISNDKVSASDKRIRFHNEDERDEHKRMISKRHHALLVNANFTPKSIYSTLTFSNENECHDFIDSRVLRDRFWRKIKALFPNAKMIIYMGRGKTTKRIHLHMISDGIPIEDLDRLWIYGTITEHSYLREHNYDKHGKDLGCDYTALANYLFDHWTKEQGKGKRYKCTKNLEQPETEKATICINQYSEQKPPKAPKGYIYTDDCIITKYGYMRFHYVKEPQKPPILPARLPVYIPL